MAFTTCPRCRYPVGEGANRVSGGTGQSRRSRRGRIFRDISVQTMLIEPTDAGLYCSAGGFHIDPWKPVPRAVITHAHGDHASPGSEHYLAAEPGRRILQKRLGDAADIATLPYGEVVEQNGVRISFHPAGHV